MSPGLVLPGHHTGNHLSRPEDVVPSDQSQPEMVIWVVSVAILRGNCNVSWVAEVVGGIHNDTWKGMIGRNGNSPV